MQKALNKSLESDRLKAAWRLSNGGSASALSGLAMITAAFVDRSEQWLAARTVAVGTASLAQTPSAHVGVWREGDPALLVQIFGREECEAFKCVRSFRDVVCVGYGEQAHFVDVAACQVRSIELEGYFGHMYTPEEFALPEKAFGVLIASGRSLRLLTQQGEQLWLSPELGVDGVVVHDVSGGVIKGAGEWDPPGGWEEFEVALETGRRTT